MLNVLYNNYNNDFIDSLNIKPRQYSLRSQYYNRSYAHNIIDDREHSFHYSTIEEIIEDAQKGKMFILVDDDSRENEGDLIIPAQKCNPESINFMSRYGRGLICLAISNQHAERLRLRLLNAYNKPLHGTAFTASIDAKLGISTGISAYDRDVTIKTAICSGNDYRDIVSPGHVFPLVAKNNGVLARPGHTEASVDISTYAGLDRSAVICEIMNDDGSMARRDDLVQFARLHGIKLGTIEDLIEYRIKSENVIKLVYSTVIERPNRKKLELRYYNSTITESEYIVVVKGETNRINPVPVYIHTHDLFCDVLADFTNTNASISLRHLVDKLEHQENGILIIKDMKHHTFNCNMQSNNSDTSNDSPKYEFLKEQGIIYQILDDIDVYTILKGSSEYHDIDGLGRYGITFADDPTVGIV